MTTTERPEEFIRAEKLPEHPLLKGPHGRVLGRSTIMKLLAEGTIPSRLIGRARIVRLADVEAFLAGGVTR